MQINIAIKNTISVFRVKEVCKSVKYHSDNVGKNTAKYNNINTILTSSNGEDVIDNNFILIYLVD